MLTVYSKVNCSYCDAVEKLFSIKDIEYKKLLLSVDYTREDFIEKFGEGTTFPRVLDENGETIGGSTETLLHLKSKGLL